MAKPPAFSEAQLAVLGDALRRLRTELAAERDAAIAKAFSDKCTMSYRGVWATNMPYIRGDAVTVGGAMFVAVSDATPGERPGKSSSWRLAVKSEVKGGPTLV